MTTKARMWCVCGASIILIFIHKMLIISSNKTVLGKLYISQRLIQSTIQQTCGTSSQPRRSLLPRSYCVSPLSHQKLSFTSTSMRHIEDDEKEFSIKKSMVSRSQILGSINSVPYNENKCILQSKSKTLNRFHLYNWRPDLNLSDDENYMDLVLLITRNSKLRQGSMGCIIVNKDRSKEEKDLNQRLIHADCSQHRKKWNRCDDILLPSKKGEDNARCQSEKQRPIFDPSIELFKSLDSYIIAAATNESFYRNNSSDIHAEIVALGQCNQSEDVHSTTQCTIYITMPPCKNCFSALSKAGIKRIVSRMNFPEMISNVAKRENIELVNLSLPDSDFIMKQNTRIKELINRQKNE